MLIYPPETRVPRTLLPEVFHMYSHTCTHTHTYTQVVCVWFTLLSFLSIRPTRQWRTSHSFFLHLFSFASFTRALELAFGGFSRPVSRLTTATPGAPYFSPLPLSFSFVHLHPLPSPCPHLFPLMHVSP